VDTRLESLTVFGLPGVRVWLEDAVARHIVTVGCITGSRPPKSTIGSVYLSEYHPVHVLPISSLRALRTNKASVHESRKVTTLQIQASGLKSNLFDLGA
jgi:hypothetical protein